MKKLNRLIFEFQQHLQSWRVKSVKYDMPLPHDLVHHEVRILVISLPAIFTHSSFQRGLKMRKGIFTGPFKVQVMSRLPEPEPDQFAPLFLL